VTESDPAFIAAMETWEGIHILNILITVAIIVFINMIADLIIVDTTIITMMIVEGMKSQGFLEAQPMVWQLA
jgi:hypothetical protein